MEGWGGGRSIDIAVTNIQIDAIGNRLTIRGKKSMFENNS